MIWAALLLLGVPAWLCAVGILVLVLRNRSLRKRPGNVPVRVLQAGATRWRRGHGLWVADVFAWRGSPAAWREELVHVVAAETRAPDQQERDHLHGLGDRPVVVELRTEGGTVLRAACAGADAPQLLGPFAAAAPVS